MVARDLGDRRSEGQFSATWVRCKARLGRFDEARAALDAGAALLRQASDRFDLGVLLCGRAELEWRSGERQNAFATLSDVEAIEAAVGAEGGSELSSALDSGACPVRGARGPAGARHH